MSESVVFGRIEIRSTSVADFYVGMAVPYGEISYRTEHRDGERFVVGAFRRAVAAIGNGWRFPLLVDHDRDVGSVIHLEETSSGLVAGLRFASSIEGRTAIEDAASRPIGLSVGFVAVDTARGSQGERVVVDATLDHLSIVEVPAYESARTFVPVSDSSDMPTPSFATRSAIGNVRSHVPGHLRDLWS